MSFGIPLKVDIIIIIIIIVFWFLLNLIQTDVYALFILELIDSVNQEHSKVIIGGVLENIAARDSEQKLKITKYVLDKLLNFEERKAQLNYSNFAISEFYLIIIFISSNYLFVSGEHRVHCNTNVCSRFCWTIRPFQCSFLYPPHPPVGERGTES